MFADVNQARSSYHIINPGWPPACCYCLLIGVRGFILTLLTSRSESTFFCALTSGEHINDIWIHLPRGVAIRWLCSIFSYKSKAKIAAWSSAAAVFSSFFFFFVRAINIIRVRDSVESSHGITKYGRGCQLHMTNCSFLQPQQRFGGRANCIRMKAQWCRILCMFSELMVHSIHLLVLAQSCQCENKFTSLQLASFTPKNERKSCKMLIKTQDDVLKSPFQIRSSCRCT